MNEHVVWEQTDGAGWRYATIRSGVMIVSVLRSRRHERDGFYTLVEDHNEIDRLQVLLRDYYERNKP